MAIEMTRNAHVFGVRGLASYFGYSDGVDEMVAGCGQLGIPGSAHIQGFLWPYSNVGNVSSQAIAAARKGKKIILLGHSMGADSVVKVAHALNAAGHKVALLACFDPTPFGCPDVPANVEKALGWWQPVGLGGYQIRPSFELAAKIEDGQAWLSTRPIKTVGHKKIDNDKTLQKIFLTWADKVTAV